MHCPVALVLGDTLELPESAARHAQVHRLQPGDPICLFQGGHAAQDNGTTTGWRDGEFIAVIEAMGRRSVQVRVLSHHAVSREAAVAVGLMLGMPANDRMDDLVEKATELGVASIHPLQAERSVLRLNGERAERRQAHWQAVAVAACSQCGRNRVPPVAPVTTFAEALLARRSGPRWMLSLSSDAQPLADILRQAQPLTEATLLSGPEGGLSAAEEALAKTHGFAPVSLGARVLRADTAPLAALALINLSAPSAQQPSP